MGAQDVLKQQLQQLWHSHLPQLLYRISTLESALNSLDNLSEIQQEEARLSAHNLAGVLGTFGLQKGTEIARQFEAAFSEGTVSAKPDLQAQLAELRTMIETHKI